MLFYDLHMGTDELYFFPLQFTRGPDNLLGYGQHTDIMKQCGIIKNLSFLFRQIHHLTYFITDTDCHHSIKHHRLSDKSHTIHQHFQEPFLILVGKEHIFYDFIQFLLKLPALYPAKQIILGIALIETV